MNMIREVEERLTFKNKKVFQKEITILMKKRIQKIITKIKIKIKIIKRNNYILNYITLII